MTWLPNADAQLGSAVQALIMASPGGGQALPMQQQPSRGPRDSKQGKRGK